MLFVSALISALFVSNVAAQLEANQTYCDKYSAIVLDVDIETMTPDQQYTFLQTFVNSAVVGYQNPGDETLFSDGILSEYLNAEGQNVTLAGFFSGAAATTNRNNAAVQVNFLDGGAGDSLTNNTNLEDQYNETNQFTLFSHLYQYFGGLLGCRYYGENADFPTYQGESSMYEAHKFMGLTTEALEHFIGQVGATLVAYGGSVEDATAIGGVLTDTFAFRCLPAAAVVTTDAALQSICLDSACEEASPSDCPAYVAAGANPDGSGNTGGSFGARVVISSIVSTLVFAKIFM